MKNHADLTLCPAPPRPAAAPAHGGPRHANPRYITRLSQVAGLSEPERRALAPVVEKYAFRANEYYLSLIDWNDPHDPIRRLIIPSAQELEGWGQLDASGESLYKKAPGLEHKYEYTALLLANDSCGGYCRFCFRKRLFMSENDEVATDLSQALDYIRRNPQINNVLLTGGDPLLLSTARLGALLTQLRAIEHVQIIRIGSKMPAFNPYRILNDPALLGVLAAHSLEDKKIYLMTHFNHPRELTAPAIRALNLLQRAGVVTVSQTPLVRGVNDEPAVLGELFNRLSYVGVPPYYVFQGRPTSGNRMFMVPLEAGYQIFEQARMKCSGLAKRARFVMSHVSGKIEVVGQSEEQIFFRYHRAANYDEKAKFFVCRRNPEAYWFDDYAEVVDSYQIQNPFRCYGPE